MRIEVVGRNIDVTDPIREYAEKRCEKLERYLDMVQQITYTIEKESAAKEVFKAELVVDVEHHANFVSHDTGHDMYALLDSVTDKAARQLTDFKERLKLNKR
ncbi:MAG: hypothetical protein DHS20C14_04710 [Phycisphaeraceae bacterium]|nr:MAG: hypothetical protein DHS20C14_04710 [Phycisphaeraceae bacterium]